MWTISWCEKNQILEVKKNERVIVCMHFFLHSKLRHFSFFSPVKIVSLWMRSLDQPVQHVDTGITFFFFFSFKRILFLFFFRVCVCFLTYTFAKPPEALAQAQGPAACQWSRASEESLNEGSLGSTRTENVPKCQNVFLKTSYPKKKKKEKKLPLPSRWPWISASHFPSNSLKMLKHRIRQQKYSQKFPLSVLNSVSRMWFFFFFNMFQKVQKKKRERQGSSYHGAKRESTCFFFSFLYYLFVFICEITSRNLLSIWTNHRDDDSKKKKLILTSFF